jgi:hypothetical protein
VLLLEGGTLKGAQIFSQEQEFKIEALGREERAQALDLKEAFHFSEWLTAQGGRWGSIYIAPTSKMSRWEVFHLTSSVNLSGVWRKASESWPQIGQVRWLHRTSLVKASRNR